MKAIITIKIMYKEFLNLAIKSAKKAGKLALQASKKTLTIETKSLNDLVTNADKASEKLIIQMIHKAFPSHAIMGEESTFIHKTSVKDYASSEYIWMIDPIDGTANYAHQLKQYAISIGLFKSNSMTKSKNFQYLNGELIAGVVFAPAMDELFYATKGGGAYLNGKRIHVSKTQKLKDSFMATGFPCADRAQNMPYFNVILEHSLGIRRLGAASLDLCYTAAGRFDGYWEFDMKPWDIAAGALIVEEAGGSVTDSNGKQIDLYGKDIFVSNGKIHKEILTKFTSI